jgi:hypothetical protein
MLECVIPEIVIGCIHTGEFWDLGSNTTNRQDNFGTKLQVAILKVHGEILACEA